jgi:hypothetical protein
LQGIGTNSNVLTGASASCVVCGAEAVEPYYCERHQTLESAPSEAVHDSAPQAGSSTRVTLGTRNEERGLAKRGFSSSCSTPSVTEDEAPEVEQLLDLHAAGRLEPIPVELPPLPDGATATMREVYEFFKLVHGLRLEACDHRDVPFACGWVADKLGLSKKSVHRVLAQLDAAGVLRQTGSLPGRGSAARTCGLPSGTWRLSLTRQKWRREGFHFPGAVWDS